MEKGAGTPVSVHTVEKKHWVYIVNNTKEGVFHLK